jgi:hypothetical protein
MITLFSKCGANCAQCPSYKNNLITEEDRQNCSQGWHTYHRFRLKPEKLIACDGCQPIGKNGNGTRYISCIVRRCALHNEVETCAHCAAYPCEVLTSRVLGNEWVNDLVERVGEIPEDDYNVYVEPYLAIPHLDAIRSSLDPGSIMAIQPISIKPRLAAYPPALESTQGYESIYQLLQNLNIPFTGLSYAQAEKQKEKRSHILKILYSFGLFGELDENMNALLLDHKIYLAQKIHSNYDRVCSYFNFLEGHGVHCEVIPLNEDRWLTPTRALRRQGVRETAPPWVMKMSCDESIGGVETLRTLRNYASVLDEAYGRTAYRRFARADLSVMLRS